MLACYPPPGGKTNFSHVTINYNLIVKGDRMRDYGELISRVRVSRERAKQQHGALRGAPSLSVTAWLRYYDICVREYRLGVRARREGWTNGN